MWTYQAGVIAALAKVDASEQGLASGVINTSVQIGSGLGVAIAAALYVADGIIAALCVAFAFAVANWITATFVLRDIAPHETPERHVIPLGKGIAQLHG